MKEIRSVLRHGRVGLLTIVAFFWAITARAQSIGLSSTVGTYSQSFDTLSSTVASSALPSGWSMLETGINANAFYGVGIGAASTGDTYSFGAAGNSERALGSLLGSSLTSTFGAQIVNADTAFSILSFNVSFTGEQWRLGATGRTDRLDFSYSLDATSLGSGTWTSFDSLDFTAPITSGATGALDGNLAANETTVSATLVPTTPIAPGQKIWIKWQDFAVSGANDGLAIDDFSIQANIPEPSTLALLFLSFPLMALRRRFIKH